MPTIVLVHGAFAESAIPARLQRFMAQRAGAERVVEIPSGSHAVAVSQPRAVAEPSVS
jgi:pimeloyl-ACP methyl ester carboxylesterase